MALRARLRHVLREHRGPAVVHGPDTVHAVTVDTGGDLRVSGLEGLSVPTGPIFLFLIHPQLGPKALHVVGVGVTAATEVGNLFPLGGPTDQGLARKEASMAPAGSRASAGSGLPP